MKYIVLIVLVVSIIAISMTVSGREAAYIDLIDSIDSGSYGECWTDGEYTYACLLGGGLGAYKVNPSGELWLIDTIDNGTHYGVWSDGTYVYSSTDTDLYAYTFDGSDFTWVATNSVNALYVWGDGTYIYVSEEALNDKIHALSFNGVAFTLLDSRDVTPATSERINGRTSGGVTHIFLDTYNEPLYGYVFNRTTDQTFDDSVEASYGSFFSHDVFAFGDDIFVANSDYLRALSFDGSAFSLTATCDLSIIGAGWYGAWATSGNNGTYVFSEMGGIIYCFNFDGTDFNLLDRHSGAIGEGFFGAGDFDYPSSGFIAGCYDNLKAFNVTLTNFSSNEIWCSPAMDNSWYNNNTTVDTFEKAMMNINEDGTIHVWAGTYVDWGYSRWSDFNQDKTDPRIDLDGVTVIGNGTSNTFFDAAYYGLRVDAENVSVSNIDFDGYDASIRIAGNNATVQSCSSYGSDWDGVLLTSCRDCIVDKFDITGNTHGIYLGNVINCNISGCSIDGATNAGIQVKNGESNILYNNIVNNTVASSIEIEGTTGLLCSRNTIKNGGNDAIDIDSTTDSVFIYNHIENDGDEGFLISDSDHLDFINNTVRDCSGMGFYVDNSDDLNIFNNTIDGNSRGIYSTSGNWHYRWNITGNYITNNHLYGFTLVVVADSIFYNNYIENNRCYAHTCTGTRWNISKTLGTNIIGGPYLGGNYWDTCFSGDADGDGLGDTPFDWCRSDIDYLPLVKHPMILYVDDDFYEGGSNAGHIWDYDAFDTISNATDVVLIGGTIYVWKGIYYPYPLFDDDICQVERDGVSIIGNGTSATILDGLGASGIYIQGNGESTDDVTIAHLTITNTSGMPSWGSPPWGGGETAIHVAANDVLIENCNIYDNRGVGIGFLGDHQTYHGLIVRNCTISCNTNETETNYGILLDQVSDVTIHNNTFSYNDVGLLIFSSKYTTVLNNTFLYNDVGLNYSSNLIEYYSPIGNLVYNNYFKNTINVLQNENLNYSIRWNITKTLGDNIVGGDYLGGNYWDDYNGSDTDGDGLGDTFLPYNETISGFTYDNTDNTLYCRPIDVPLAEGDVANSDGGDPADNWMYVDDVTPDNDTTWVKAVGTSFEIYDLEDISLEEGQVISSITLVVVARTTSDDKLDCIYGNVTDGGGELEQGYELSNEWDAYTFTIPTTYGGDAWDESNFNDYFFGWYINTTGEDTVYVTQVYAIVNISNMYYARPTGCEDFLGDTANSDGGDQDPADNWMYVDDVTPDNDTTWVNCSTPMGGDLYQVSNISLGEGDVIGPVTLVIVAMSDTNDELAGFFGIDLAHGAITETYILSGEWETYTWILPTTWDGEQWNESNFNSSNFGWIDATGIDETIYVTQFYVMVGTSFRANGDYHPLISGDLKCDFHWSPIYPESGKNIKFYDDSTGIPTSWKWKWGDDSSGSTSKNPTHIYGQPGTYTVKLTVSDGTNYDIRTKLIHVGRPAVFIPDPQPPLYAGFTVEEMYHLMHVDRLSSSDAELTVMYIDSGVTRRMYNGTDLSRIQALFHPSTGSPWDEYGHGTFVGYEIQYIVQEKLPKTKVISYRIFGDGPYTESNVFIDALEQAKQIKPDILSISAGTIGNPSDIFCKKVDELRSMGVIVICAAGNYGPASSSITSPGCGDSAIAIGGEDPQWHDNEVIRRQRIEDLRDDLICVWSSRGPVPDVSQKPDVAAPGESIIGPWCNAEVVKSGTSMSTPLISGGAAVILAGNKGLVDFNRILYFWWGGLVPNAFENALKESCYQKGNVNDWGAGIPQFDDLNGAFFWKMVFWALIPFIIIGLVVGGYLIYKRKTKDAKKNISKQIYINPA